MDGESDYSIWKYELLIIDDQDIKLPDIYMPLSVGIQNNKLCLWCHVDTKAPRVTVNVRIIGTGNPADINGHEFVGTIDFGSRGIWHVFIET